MAKKPANLIYGVDDKPPLSTTLVLGFQHVMILFISVIFPAIIDREWGAQKEVIFNASSAINEVMESVTAAKLTTDKVKIKMPYHFFLHT